MKNKRYPVHQLFFRNLTDVGAANQHAPTLRVEKPCDEVGQSGFSAAGSPYKRNGLPRLDGERYIVQRVFLPVVAVAYMFQANAVAFRLAAREAFG